MTITTPGGSGSGISTRHPQYGEFSEDWRQMRDTYRGERIVKERGFDYLSATSGMILDGVTNPEQAGSKAYTAYRRRARFPDFVRDTVESMLGVMHHKPPVIELPESMEPLREKATLRGESLDMLLRRMNEEQLIMGRLGLLLEVPEKAIAAKSETPGQVLPLIAMYHAEKVINWDEGDRDSTEVDALNLVVIDETELERDDKFSWKTVEKHRVLVLGDVLENENEGGGAYRVANIRERGQFADADLITPSITGKTLDFIPFVFVNTKDVTPTPDDPPILGLSNLALTVYRGEADYRQSLFMQGQDTLVTVGATANEGNTRRTGAGASIDLPMGASAEYIGVASEGLAEQRTALENDYDRGNQKAGALLESVSRGAESGEALRVRVAARTASLNQIAMTGAFGLQEALRMLARWIGADPEKVIVTPNLDFVADIMPGQELVHLMAAKGLGAPLALETIHGVASERGLTDLSFEEEIKLIEAEAEAGLPGAGPAAGEADDGGSTNPEGPQGDDDPNEEGDDDPKDKTADGDDGDDS